MAMHHPGNVLSSAGAAEYIAAAIPGAVGPVPIASLDLELWASQPPMLADEVERFVTGSAKGTSMPPAGRTVSRLWSTRTSWSQLAEPPSWATNAGVRSSKCTTTRLPRQIERHQGRLVKRTGDGVLATFDGPGRAVHSAQAILSDTHQLGVEPRGGLHAGEVELLGDDIAGIAAHIAARVMDFAGAGEVVVFRTIKDLVAGSGLRFDGPRITLAAPARSEPKETSRSRATSTTLRPRIPVPSRMASSSASASAPAPW